ncbi:MAG: hypothetical protein HOY75_41680, partial [Streptomyces sp.]|nr:hypothetical protein [Streptomyces sp.]
MADTGVAGLRLDATWGLDFPGPPGECSFVAMGGELLAGASGGGGQHAPGTSGLGTSGPGLSRPLDYLVVAHEAYDAAPAGLAAGFLAEACPGEPRAFSIADQGIGAPFSGLKVLDRIHRSGGLSDAALFVLDPAAGAVLALSDLGEVRHAPAPPGTAPPATAGGAPGRVVAAPATPRQRHIDHSAQYEGAAPPCDAPPATAGRGPLHRTTRERTPPPRGRSGGTGGWALETVAEERAGDAADCLPLLGPAARTSYVLGDGLRDLAGPLEAAGATVR